MGVIDQLDSAGALPALDRMIRFAGARHELIAHNIANLETPGFIPADVDPRAFQEHLAEAIDERRGRRNGNEELDLESTDEVKVGRGGRLVLEPRTASGNILFHDRNNRDLERTMQSMVENASMFRVATDLYRNRTTLLRDAMSERVG